MLLIRRVIEDEICGYLSLCWDDRFIISTRINDLVEFQSLFLKKIKGIFANPKVTILPGGAYMSKEKDNTPEKFKTELGGMGLYGTTSNTEIAGYVATGDIENAGQLDKGFKNLNERIGCNCLIVSSGNVKIRSIDFLAIN